MQSLCPKFVVAPLEFINNLLGIALSEAGTDRTHGAVGAGHRTAARCQDRCKIEFTDKVMGGERVVVDVDGELGVVRLVSCQLIDQSQGRRVPLRL